METMLYLETEARKAFINYWSTMAATGAYKKLKLQRPVDAEKGIMHNFTDDEKLEYCLGQVEKYAKEIQASVAMLREETTIT